MVHYGIGKKVFRCVACASLAVVFAAASLAAIPLLGGDDSYASAADAAAPPVSAYDIYDGWPQEPPTVNPPATDSPAQIEIFFDAGIKWKKTAMTCVPAYGQKSLTITYGEKLGELPVYYKTGYLMKGWYTKKKGGKRVNASSKANFASGTKLYAQWKKASTKKIAQAIAKNSKKQKTTMDRLQAAADSVAAYYNQCEYTSKSKTYNIAQGVFVDGTATCAGATRALGMVLDYMGYKWKHMNPNKWTHQWCKVYTKDGVMWADGGVTNIGAYDEILGLVGKGERKM
ncbi:MAG: InlB B-repeat-containing protein [Clostridiales Family XIII bacterium]|jgi:hypothetical protein|nr:InlB B-repeat-containing protein [Clostridiales Family XIII bacterium]